MNFEWKVSIPKEHANIAHSTSTYTIARMIAFNFSDALERNGVNL